MQLLSVRAVMAFVTAPLEAAAWWSSLTQVPVQQAGEFAWLDLPGGTELGFHPADGERNPLNGNPVVYWAVPDLDATRRALLTAGAVHHRGPFQIAQGRRICQLKDPFGVIVGLDGP